MVMAVDQVIYSTAAENFGPWASLGTTWPSFGTGVARWRHL